MELNITTVTQITVVEIAGNIDAKTVTEVQERIAPLILAGCKLLLDMRRVTYMSSAGMRMLLTTYREVSATNGILGVVGLSEEIRDTMDAIGFLRYFSIYETVDAGMAVLNQSGRR
jgi:anti-sigma B factor antagonist